ncbi:hypothetical protein AWENTII_008291 [Aspergillus wentii]
MQTLPIFIPISYFALSVGAFFIATTVQSRYLLPFILLPSYLSFRTADHWPGDVSSLWGLLICIWVAHSTSFLWLEDPEVWEETKRTHHGRIAKYIPVKYHRALKQWNNPRLLGTTRQSIPAYEYSPSIRRFTITRTAKLLAYCTAYTWGKTHIFPAWFMPIQFSEFDPSHQVYFRRLLSSSTPITPRETQMRAVFVLWWAFAAVSMLDAAHAALSLIAVPLLRLDTPSEWPPIFGLPSNAWSMRRFWGRFWHQIVVRPYKNHAKWLSRRIIGLRSGSGVDKVVVIFLIFLFSGVAHAGVAWQLGDHCGWGGDVWWFCMNFVAGAVEVVILKMVNIVMQRCGQKARWERLRGGLLGRAFGYMWVFGFLFWSVPKWQYAKVYCHLQDVLEME